MAYMYTVLSLICFVRIDFSEQYCIDVDKNQNEYPQRTYTWQLGYRHFNNKLKKWWG